MLHTGKQVYQTRLTIDARAYRLWVWRRAIQPPDAPRLVIVSHQPNRQASAVLRVCIEAIQRYTPEPHELWVVDNHSPWQRVVGLLRYSNVNLVANRTQPLPPEDRSFWSRLRGGGLAQERGSYSNALALEVATRLIDPQTHYLMALHMDTAPCATGWLSYLQSKINRSVAAAGVRLDRVRTAEGVLHVLGYMVDFQRFRELGLDFWPRLPQYDVGDWVTVGLRAAGYQVFACPNTMWEPDLVETLPPSSPLRTLSVDRAFDDQGQVIFLHLGRGVRKSVGKHIQGTTPQEWVRFAHQHLLR